MKTQNNPMKQKIIEKKIKCEMNTLFYVYYLNIQMSL